MAILADRNKPFNGLSSNIVFGVFSMVDLASASAAINTAPVISLEHYITLPLPYVRFKIFIPVIVATTFTSHLENPTVKYQIKYQYD